MRRPVGPLVIAAVTLVALAVAGVGCGRDGGSARELCARLGDRSRFERTLGDGLALDNPTRAKEQLTTMARQLGTLYDAAPDEVRDALAVLIDAVSVIGEAVEEGSDQAMRDAERTLAEHRAQIEAANAELETFRQTACGTPTTD